MNTVEASVTSPASSCRSASSKWLARHLLRVALADPGGPHKKLLPQEQRRHDGQALPIAAGGDELVALAQSRYTTLQDTHDHALSSAGARVFQLSFHREKQTALCYFVGALKQGNHRGSAVYGCGRFRVPACQVFAVCLCQLPCLLH